MNNNNLGLRKVAVQLIDRDRWYKAPVSQSVGRVLNIPQAATVGTLRGILHTSKGKDMEELIRHYENEKEQHLKEKDNPNKTATRRLINYLLGTGDKKQGELTVATGGAVPLHNLKKVWTRPGISFPGRILGSVNSPAADLTGTLARADHYNPFAHTVTSYTDDPAIKAHELGHAADFQDKNWPLLYTAAGKVPLIPLYQELMASSRAAGAVEKLRKKINEDRNKDKKNMTEKTEKQKKEDKKKDKLYSNARLQRLLGGGFGSYAGAHMSPFGVLPGALVGQIAGRKSSKSDGGLFHPRKL